mgnify:CR=1 FL=1
MTQYSTPFEFFTCPEALLKTNIKQIIDLFDQEHDWEIHDSFYKASIADVSTKIDRDLLRGLSDRVAKLTGTKLSGRVEVRIQKMDKGQYSGVHTDRPLLGFEAVRLIVQLNDDWSIERDGGALRIHGDDNEESVAMVRSPIMNSGFGFVMTSKAHHSVQVTNRERRSVVFYFWHVGNTQRITDWVNTQLSGNSFAELPDYLSDKISMAEQFESEEDTFRAATVAWLLYKWGCGEESVSNGYQSAISCDVTPSSREELLASWIYSMKHESFDVSKWRLIRRSFLREKPHANPIVQEAFSVCFDSGVA